MDPLVDDFLNLNRQYVLNTYGRTPVMLVEGRGCRVRDSNGQEYLDFVAGLAACILGHGHQGLAKAIADQAARLIHVSNIYHIEPQIRLARILVENSFADKVFFCNSGAEANEGAIKLARKYFHDQGQHERFHVITMEGSFHGRTLATLAATGQTKYRKGFEPEVQGFSHVPFGNIDALEIEVTPGPAAVMIEPFQGEGGVKVPRDRFLNDARQLCDDRGCLLILDEVQTGMGRTGKLFAHEHSRITPDVMTLAKGIAGGVPMGALLVSEKASGVLTPGTHASTFGGNPLACAAGLAVMDEIMTPGFLDAVVNKGVHLKYRLEDLARRHDVIKEVRGIGLMQAIELREPGADLSRMMLERGVLVNCTADTALRFLPPLIVSTEEIDEMTRILDSALSSWKVG